MTRTIASKTWFSGLSTLVTPKPNRWAKKQSIRHDSNADFEIAGPTAANTKDTSNRWRRLKSKFDRSGWRWGVQLSACGVILSLLVNVGVTTGIYLGPNDFNGGVANIYHGDCSKNETINTVIHLLINALSTLLLAGSNYTMQVLAAPTRLDIDRAHYRKRWLDVGLQSVRNVFHINKTRATLWWMLALSSIPLHLLSVAIRQKVDA